MSRNGVLPPLIPPYDTDLVYTAIDPPGTPQRKRRVANSPQESYRTPRIVEIRSPTGDTDEKLQLALVQQDRVLNQQERVTDLLGQQQQLTNSLIDRSNQNSAEVHKVAEVLSQQQQLSRALIDRAFENKEAVIKNMNEQHAMDIEDHTQALMGDHVRYMTAIVKRLNLDIESMEEQLKARDWAVVGTNSAVNKLEVHHVTMLQDLKARIVRCDASLAKHSGDIRLAYEDMRQESHKMQAVKERLTEQIFRLESEIISTTAEIDRQAGELRTELTHLRGNMNKEIAVVDERSRSQMDDVKNTVSMHKVTADADRDKLEAKLLSMLDKATISWNNMTERIERRIEENFFAQEVRIQKLEDSMAAQNAKLSDIQNRLAAQVMKQVESNARSQVDSLSRAKREFREGFTSVHESIKNMKTLTEGKLRLTEDSLRKEIKLVKKIMEVNNEDDF